MAGTSSQTSCQVAIVACRSSNKERQLLVHRDSVKAAVEDSASGGFDFYVSFLFYNTASLGIVIGECSAVGLCSELALNILQ